ncbi:MAG TPA: flippase activity-associated protein Agl23 [Patescibacteria group bacterium]|nr:flippase activity-associated protein Agl23 [Patescibacteria group bacterium]
MAAPAGDPSLEPTSPVPAAPADPAQPAIRRVVLLAGLGLVALLFAIAGVVRLWDLPLAPFHNDEGVNGWFTAQLLRTGTWAYDPANYHGPTLFYAAAASAFLFGLGDVSMRLVPAVFGLATLGLVLLAWRWIGRAGAIAATALLAFSPGMVFFSRYVIHEMLLVFFTLALVLAAARWWETGRTRFLLAAAAAAAAMFATKETTIITVVVLGLSVGCLAIYERLAPRIPGRGGRPPWQALSVETGGGPSARARPGRRRTVDPLARFGGRDELTRSLAASAVVFSVVWVTLFSSFFTNPAGIADSFGSLAIWKQTAGMMQVSGPLTYVGWMVEEELPLLLLGLGGAALAAWEGRSRFAVFAAAWATGLLLGYSLIGYKTPWLMLSWLLPYALVAGYALGRAWEARRPLVRVGATAALAAALALSLVQAVQLAFRDYDLEENAYVYAQTQRDVLDLVEWLRTEDDRLGAGGQMGIVLMTPDYWPLPWYLRDNTKAGFYAEVVDVAAPVQIVKEDQLASLPAGFADRYREDARYTLRPGVELVVFVERDP